LLLEKGFKVVSQAVAEEKVKLQSESEDGVLAKGKSSEDQYTAWCCWKESIRAGGEQSQRTEVHILRFK